MPKYSLNRGGCKDLTAGFSVITLVAPCVIFFHLDY